MQWASFALCRWVCSGLLCLRLSGPRVASAWRIPNRNSMISVRRPTTSWVLWAPWTRDSARPSPSCCSGARWVCLPMPHQGSFATVMCQDSSQRDDAVIVPAHHPDTTFLHTVPQALHLFNLSKWSSFFISHGRKVYYFYPWKTRRLNKLSAKCSTSIAMWWKVSDV